MQDAFEEAMDELGVGTTGSDIAAFLRSELPELEEKRRNIVSLSVEEARGRDQTPVSNSSDEAFAPTVMRERLLGARTASPLGPSESSISDDEPIRIPKQSRAWLWSLLLVIAAGIGVRLTRPALLSHALDRVAPGWVSQWLSKEEGSSPQMGAQATEPARASSPSSAASNKEPESTADGPHKPATPKPSAAPAVAHGSAAAVIADVGGSRDAGPMDGRVLARPQPSSAAPGAPSNAPAPSATAVPPAAVISPTAAAPAPSATVAPAASVDTNPYTVPPAGSTPDAAEPTAP